MLENRNVWTMGNFAFYYGLAPSLFTFRHRNTLVPRVPSFAASRRVGQAKDTCPLLESSHLRSGKLTRKTHLRVLNFHQFLPRSLQVLRKASGPSLPGNFCYLWQLRRNWGSFGEKRGSARIVSGCLCFANPRDFGYVHWKPRVCGLQRTTIRRTHSFARRRKLHFTSMTRYRSVT